MCLRWGLGRVVWAIGLALAYMLFGSVSRWGTECVSWVLVVPGVVGEKCWVCFVFFSYLDFYFLSFDFLIWDCPMSLRFLPAQTLLMLYLV